jgi:hypothetical protein
VADFGLSPAPPAWALAAGLPEPEDGEGFDRYVTRLGLDCAYFFEDLTERTAELANLRLASYLIDVMPGSFRAHVRALSLAHLDDGRRKELTWIRQTLPHR